MMLKVIDFVKTLLWYIVNFIYSLVDVLIKIIKELNAFDIINSLSDNKVFQIFYRSVCVIAVTLLALFIIWKIINKFLEPDSEVTIKHIAIDAIKCSLLILLSTFMFAKVSTFSITLSNYTGNIFETSTNATLGNNILSMFVTYNEDYENSSEFDESKSITELISNGSFNKKKIYLDKFIGEEEDYKYDVNWIMAILCGGFFLYSLFFAGIMLGRRQIEFLFLFAIAPVVFSTSVCNKQRRGAVIEQLVSLVLQSAVVMVILGLTVLIMQQINETTFFQNGLQDMVTKSLLYLGCGTFILTGSQTINRFIGANVSAASGREQLMSLMGYGKLATAGAVTTGAAAIGGGLLAAGGAMKVGKSSKNTIFSHIGAALGTYGQPSYDGKQTRIQKMASAIGTRMYASSQKSYSKSYAKKNNFASDAFVRAGASSINSAVRRVMPRASYNASYYRRKKSMM